MKTLVVDDSYPKAIIAGKEDKPKEIPAYKLSQREAERKSKLCYRITPENNNAGTVFPDMTGRKYQVQVDGSWRRVKP